MSPLDGFIPSFGPFNHAFKLCFQLSSDHFITSIASSWALEACVRATLASSGD